MLVRETFETAVAYAHVEPGDGWPIYVQAMNAIAQGDWDQARLFLADAEMRFRARADCHGLWRALLGRALWHWRSSATALATAQLLAALRAAEAAGDAHALAFVVWQCAHLALGRGDYQSAAAYLDQAQTVLSSAMPSLAGWDLAAVLRLCIEQVRWQQACLCGQVGPCEAVAVLAEVRRSLSEHLAQVALHGAGVGERAVAFLSPAPPSVGLSSGSGQRLSAPALPQVLVVELPMGATTPPDAAPGLSASGQDSVATGRRRLTVACFGDLQVALDGVPVARWKSVRSRELFHCLVLNGAVRVTRLAEMFWPDSEPRLARRSLHQAAYQLNQTFKSIGAGMPVVCCINDRYQINPELAVSVDVKDFQRAITQARALLADGKTEAAMRAYTTATELHCGRVFGADADAECISALQPVYSAMYREALHQLAHYHHEQGDYATAIRLGQRMLAHERCDEAAHRLLMACYSAQGLRHLAVRQYQVCVNALRTELGLLPSDEMERFYRQVVVVG